MKLLLCLILMIHPTFSHAEEPGLNRAAVQALKDAFNAPNGTQWEYGGNLYLQDKTIHWTTPPHTDQMFDGNITNPKKMIMPGQTLIGVYHTHPCLPNTHFPGYFSIPDVAFAIYQNVPEFILDECTGNVQKFDPVKDNPEDLMVDAPMLDFITREQTYRRLVRGHIIGNIGRRGPELD